MVIHTGGRSNWVYLYPAVGAGLIWAYCRSGMHACMHASVDGMPAEHEVGCLSLSAGSMHPLCFRLRGISVFDLLYVSQNSMSQFKNTVTDGFSRIWTEVRKQKEDIMAKLGLVGHKQEQLIESQSQMDERLRHVSWLGNAVPAG